MTAQSVGMVVEAGLAGTVHSIADLIMVETRGYGWVSRLPYSIRVLLENVVRHAGNGVTTEAHVRAAAGWQPTDEERAEIPFMPSRVLLQDFTGVPCAVDLAAMRSEVERRGGDPRKVNPQVPVDLVIDHSVQVDYYGTHEAYERNVALEIRRNRERYSLLAWAQHEFDDLTVVPTGTGIVHQINLEYLSSVVHSRNGAGGRWAFPDTVVGTDSHTTMINGLGVLGWGVGGIEAEAVMLGQPYFMLLPDVVGVHLTGRRPLGTTTTDIVLSITQLLRRVGVVGRFVEYFGPGLSELSVADRATIANMAPEYGATCGFFPVDQRTLDFLVATGRDPEHAHLVGEYCQRQGLFRTDSDEYPEYTTVIEFDLGTVEPSLAGPRRPQDLIKLGDVARSFRDALPALAASIGRADKALCTAEVCLLGEKAETVDRFEGEGGAVWSDVPDGMEHLEFMPPVDPEDDTFMLGDGSVVIAAITSCTNTSNPAVMLAAGLLARNAVQRGLRVPSWVKTSTTPGSRVVMSYLERSGLLPYLEALGFHIVGYGCCTCIGNSGPIATPIAKAIEESELCTASVLSGNRNFEARIHPLVRSNYLASPPLVVAYALAGSVLKDLTEEPLGYDAAGIPVYLVDIWPSDEELERVMSTSVLPSQFKERYADVSRGDATWRTLEVPSGDMYAWDPTSTYVREPPFVAGLSSTPSPIGDIVGARVLGIFGDSVTTDHISPAGAIPPDSPAGRYLIDHGVGPADFNTYGSRRGNHEVLMRGTFANVRIRNLMLEDVSGGWTVHVPSGETVPIFDAAMRYRSEDTPSVVLAGKEYGTGSSRDWAAKGPALLGVRAVIAESFERIHRSNLVGMGILPLQFEPGTNAGSLGLTGRETIDITGISDGELAPGARVEVKATSDVVTTVFPAVVRLDSPVDLEYYRHGGILPRVLRQLTGAR
jgi:aconitate hydratase